ncbi:MAG: FkbM family methyltransferase [Gammaproteobacteria bacterium]
MHKVVLPNGLEIAELNAHETKFLYDEIFVQEVYTRYGLMVPPGATVLDIGANIGMFSLYAALKYEAVNLLCFEPAPHCVELLRFNIARLGASARVFATALGAEIGEVDLSYYPHYSILSGIFADERQDLEVLRAGARTQYESKYHHPPSERELELLVGSRLQDRQTVRCPMTTLSRVLADEAVDDVALAKIDVERAEHAILAGISEAHWPKIAQFVIEVHDQGEREHELMATMLERRGYRTRIFAEPALRNSGIYVVVARR